MTQSASQPPEATDETRRTGDTLPVTPRPPVVPTPPPMPLALGQGAFVLRFVSGPRAGSEVPVAPGQAIVFGRGKEADLVLAEDLVSRRHAVLSLGHDGPMLADLGSTNGTFLNGERLHGKAMLHPGDRLLIGTTIARLHLVKDDDEEERTSVALQAPPRRSPQGSTMAGRLEEVPLVDLLQLFSNSRKSGELAVRGADGLDGDVQLASGRVARARVESHPELTHRKALARLLRLSSGAFEFIPAALDAVAPAIPSELQEPTELLLMDALRLVDELAALEPQLPKAHSMLQPVRPLPGRLSALDEPALDLFQLVLEQGTFGAVLDHSPLDDVEAARGLVRLIGLGFVQVKA